MAESPRLIATAQSRLATISRVEFIANYEDFNWEGDGVFRQWHYILERGVMRRNAGSAERLPYTAVWDTRWIPDQSRPVDIAARITDSLGVSYITPAIAVSLVRKSRSVRMYRAVNVPENFEARGGRKVSCSFEVDADISLVRAARLVMSSWSAAHFEEIALNGRKLSSSIGVAGNYSFDSIPVPNRYLQPGPNVFSVFSTAQDEAPAVNWPGPVLLVEYGVPERTATRPAWWDASWPYRVPVRVDNGRTARFDHPAQVKLDFETLGRKFQLAEPIAPDSISVVETDGQGKTIDAAVPFQFDAAEGTLTFLMTGSTQPETERRYLVYFGGPKSAKFAPRVRLAADEQYAGQDSFHILSDTASYYYQKEGAAFAGMLDPSGADWIGYRPGGRSAGEFRGIPNLGDDFGHPGNTGVAGSETRVLASGPLYVSLLSERKDRKWACRWDIFPSFARLTVLRNEKSYWFLYEGTPAGRLEKERQYTVTSLGLKRPMSEAWADTATGPEWVYFQDPRSKWALFVMRHSPTEMARQFWPMEDNMTVFGFGRQYTCCGSYFENSPEQFTIGLVPNGSYADMAAKIDSAWLPLSVNIGQPESR